MRLIDADALPKWTGYALSATEIAIEVEHAPTIDAVVVVRCEQCKHYEHGTCTKNVIRISRFPEDFCSRGKEKEECQHQ